MQSPDRNKFDPERKAFCRAAHPKTHRQKALSVPSLRVFRFAQNRSISAIGIKLQSHLKPVYGTGWLCYIRFTREQCNSATKHNSLLIMGSSGRIYAPFPLYSTRYVTQYSIIFNHFYRRSIEVPNNDSGYRVIK